MNPPTASGPGASAGVTEADRRLAAPSRREALLDAAAEMVAVGQAEDASMERVAERAGVSRALVYKHFANRHDLLDALYEREAAHLHAQLAATVTAESTLVGMLGALIRAALDAQAQRGATFAALASNVGRSTRHRRIRSRRDAQTLRFFVGQAQTDYGLDEEVAAAALAVVLGSIPSVLAEWRRHPTASHAALLAQTYVQVAEGGLRAVQAGSTEPTARSTS